MASAELNKVLELLKSQPRNPNASIEKMRAGMEKVSEHVARDVKCEAVSHRRHCGANGSFRLTRLPTGSSFICTAADM